MSLVYHFFGTRCSYTIQACFSFHVGLLCFVNFSSFKPDTVLKLVRFFEMQCKWMDSLMDGWMNKYSNNYVSKQSNKHTITLRTLFFLVQYFSLRKLSTLG